MSSSRLNMALPGHVSSHREHENEILKEIYALRDKTAKLEKAEAEMADDLKLAKADLRRTTRRNNRLNEEIKVLKDELEKVDDRYEEDITCPICSSVMWVGLCRPGASAHARVDPCQLAPCGHGACGMCVVTWINTQVSQRGPGLATR